MNHTTRIAHAAAIIRTAQIVASTHPEIWAQAHEAAHGRGGTHAAQKARRASDDDPEACASALQSIGGAATDKAWKAACDKLGGMGRSRYEKARSKLLEQGLIGAETSIKGTAKHITWALTPLGISELADTDPGT